MCKSGLEQTKTGFMNNDLRTGVFKAPFTNGQASRRHERHEDFVSQVVRRPQLEEQSRLTQKTLFRSL